MCIQIPDLSVSDKFHLWAPISSSIKMGITPDLMGLFLGLNKNECKAYNNV